MISNHHVGDYASGVLKQVRHDGGRLRHPEFISGSHMISNQHVGDYASGVLKPVQHDGGRLRHPEFISGSHTISNHYVGDYASGMLKQVQHNLVVIVIPNLFRDPIRLVTTMSATLHVGC